MFAPIVKSKNYTVCCWLKTGDDHRWLHVITDALYMVKFKASNVIVTGFYDA